MGEIDTNLPELEAERERVVQALDRIILLGHLDPAHVVETAKAARALIDAAMQEADGLYETANYHVNAFMGALGPDAVLVGKETP